MQEVEVDQKFEVWLRFEHVDQVEVVSESETTQTRIKKETF